MNKQFVREALEEYAARAVPEQPQLWLRVRQQVTTRRIFGISMRLPMTRLGWAVVSVLVLLVVTTASYASGILFGDRNLLDPMFRPLIQAPDVSEGLSRSVNGYTVTLRRIHADTQHVLIGYTIQGPDSAHRAPTDMQLTDERGTVYRPELGQAVVEGEQIEGYAMAFIVPPQVQLRDALTLHLTLNLAVTQPGGTPVPMILSGSPDQIPQRSAWALAGPFIYDFRVPLNTEPK